MSSSESPHIAGEEDRGRASGTRSRGATARDLLTLTRGLVSVWPTTLTFLAGLLATLGVWALAETYPRSERSRTLLAVANGMRQVLEVRLDDHLRGLQLASEVWSRFPMRDPIEWKAEAQMFLQQHPGIVLVAIAPGTPASPASPAELPGPVPAGGSTDGSADVAADVLSGGSTDVPADVTGEVPGDEPATPEPEPASASDLVLFEDPPADVRQTEYIARDISAKKWIVGRALKARLDEARLGAMDDQRSSIDLFKADSGQDFYQIVIPLQGPEEQSGMLCAVLQPAPLMASLISELASGYFLAVHDGTALIYTQGTPPRPSPADDVPDESDSIELPIRLLMGETWTLSMARSDLFELPTMLSLGRLVLGVGLAFSVLLAGIVYLGQVGRVRARALAIANRELRSQMVSTAVAEGRVRKINESLEARVAERTRALDEVVTELETFNYSVSHDLRSPIGAIVNFTSILTEDYKDKLDEQGVDILRRVAGCAQNAVAMMDGLLTFSHIGQQSLKLGTVEMKPVVESVWAEVVLAHPGRAPTFSVGALPSVTADATMMRTVWTNLLSNAVKFSDPTREATIEVGSQPSPEGDVFFVRDNGVGFEMKHATRLFNVFEQLHPTPQSKGHGVGLAIVSRIVRRHGGRVWAQAAPDKGATFYFSIPPKAP